MRQGRIVADSSPRIFQFEQAFIVPGNAQNGAQGVQLLGRTPGFRPDLIVEAHQLALLTPPTEEQVTPEMPAGLAILRMENAEYLLVKSGCDNERNPRLQLIMMSSAALRWLGGNLHMLEEFVMYPMPILHGVRDDLPPFLFNNPEPPDAETQTDDMLYMLRACKNDTKTVTGILAALIQGVSVGVINAPADLRARLTFVCGLLALLPIPARVPITFATSVTDPKLGAQLKFFEPGVYADGHLVFDWSARKLLSAAPDDPYAKYMVRQLKLDPSLVIEQTDHLSRTAVWRAMRKDDMTEALGWIARRASLDSAVLNNQPADREKVATVLREDPTLTEDIRAAYASHLLRFSLALNDAEYTDVIPLIAEQNPGVGDLIYEDLTNAAKSENAAAAYNMVEKWLSSPPMGIDTSRWTPLLGMALNSIHASLILKSDTDALKKFLETLLDTPPLVPLGQIVAGLLQSTYKKAYNDPDMARLVFLLAVTHLPAGGVQRLLSDPEFAQSLPPAIKEALPHLTPNRTQSAPPGLLHRMANSYGSDRYGVILARLVEWAFTAQRRDLIDAEALKGLVQVAASPQGARFDGLFQSTIQSFSSPEYVRGMSVGMLGHLVGLNLARERAADAAVQVQFYQDQVFKPTEQPQLSLVVQSAFNALPLKTNVMNDALNAFMSADLRPMVKISALYGALEAQKYTGAIEAPVKRLTAYLSNDPRLIGLNGVEPAINLLKFHTERKDIAEAARLANAIVDYLVTLGGDGTGNATSVGDVVNRVSQMLYWSPEMADPALEVMRVYIRRASLDYARAYLGQVGDRTREETRRGLETTFYVRQIMDGLEFEQFAEVVEMASQLLTDMAVTFAQGPEVMPIFKIKRVVQSATGGLTEQESFQLSDNLTIMGELIMRVYWAHQQTATKRTRTEAEQHRNALTFGSIAPSTGLEVLQWLGGRFGAGLKQLDLNRTAMPHFLGSKSQNDLLRDTNRIVALLEGLLAVFPEKTPVHLNQQAWANEINAAYENLSLQKQRRWHDALGLNAQYLWQAIREIGAKGNDKNLTNVNQGRLLFMGKAQPRSVIDSLRWLSGYFAHAQD